MKGHSTFAAHIRQEPSQRQGKRHTTRIMCDAYGKGIVRGQVDNTQLPAHSRTHDVTAAEFIKACLTDKMLGQHYVDMVQRLNDKYLAGRSSAFAEVDMRSLFKIPNNVSRRRSFVWESFLR